MGLSEDRKRQFIEENRAEYGERYPLLRFADPDRLAAATAEREQLLAELNGLGAVCGYGGTKLDCRRLSPGCVECGAGAWSCLFISGKCNRDCFYCPTSQDEIGLPTTNTLSFRRPRDYVAYLERFGFKGMSISGGEPLLTPGRTLAFIAAARAHFGKGLHIWLYTNGTLLDREILRRLREAGLDEIRFDIGAADYALKKVALAAEIIPCVTVEIPAIPEEFDLMRQKLAELRAVGVSHLNLHQLRLTPHNFEKLIQRDYTYLHGEKVTVLESELTALRLIRHGLEQGIDLPVNYCSFVYKNRFQKAATRRRNAPFVKKGFEDLTENGYLRTLTLLGDNGLIAAQIERFRRAGAAAELWALGGTKDCLSFNAALLPLVEGGDFRLLVGYGEAMQMPAVSYRNVFVEVKLTPTQKLVIEKRKVCRDMDLSAEAAAAFTAALADNRPLPESDHFEELRRYERMGQGLQEYF